MDTVKEPNHYQTNNRESIEIMKDMSTTEEFEGFLKLTAHKYLYRYNSKGNVIEDLQKAQQYIEGLINLKKYPDCDNVFRINYETESTPEHILIIYGKGFTDTRKRMKELDTDKYDKVYLSWSKDMVNSIFLENVDNFVHLEGCRREQIGTGS